MAVVIRGNFLGILRDHMKKALSIIEDWCGEKGLAINPLKTNVVVFTRKYKPESIEPVRLMEKS